jgi:hypothetical protein
VTGLEQFQDPTRGIRASKRKPYWGRYFQNINFQNDIKQNGYSYAFPLRPINREKIHVSIFFYVFELFPFHCPNLYKNETICEWAGILWAMSISEHWKEKGNKFRCFAEPVHNN